jgi:hypothetical protein
MKIKHKISVYIPYVDEIDSGYNVRRSTQYWSVLLIHRFETLFPNTPVVSHPSNGMQGADYLVFSTWCNGRDLRKNRKYLRRVCDMITEGMENGNALLEIDNTLIL